MSVFMEKYESFLMEFAKGKTMVLSSSENNKVTSRMMSIVHNNGLFYFQTDKTFRKYHQLISNPQIALCADNIQIEGVCKEIGHPMDNAAFGSIYKECTCPKIKGTLTGAFTVCDYLFSFQIGSFSSQRPVSSL